MRLGRIDKLYLLTQACTTPTQSGWCIVGAPLVLRRATSNSDTQDSPRPGLGGSHHLPLYNILCGYPRGPLGSPEIAKVGTPVTLGRHNFTCRSLIKMRSEQSCSPCQDLFNGMSHAICTHGNWVDF
jgi:hypothetical protein